MNKQYLEYNRVFCSLFVSVKVSIAKAAYLIVDAGKTFKSSQLSCISHRISPEQGLRQ